MTRKSEPDRPLPPDRLIGEAIFDGYRNPASTEDACDRVRQLLLDPAPVSTRHPALRWRAFVRAAAAIAIVVGVWMTAMPRTTEAPITVSIAIDHDRGFPEMGELANRLALIQANISQFDEEHFWGDRPLQPQLDTKEMNQR